MTTLIISLVAMCISICSMLYAIHAHRKVKKAHDRIMGARRKRDLVIEGRIAAVEGQGYRGTNDKKPDPTWQDLPPDVYEAHERGVMSNDQMEMLLRATGNELDEQDGDVAE